MTAAGLVAPGGPGRRAGAAAGGALGLAVVVASGLTLAAQAFRWLAEPLPPPVDEALYLSYGRHLATGAQLTAWDPAFPPGLPWLWSLTFRVTGSEALPRAMCVLMAVGGLACLAALCRRALGPVGAAVAAGAAALWGTSWFVVFHAHQALSDLPGALFVVGALLFYWERVVRRQDLSPLTLAVLGAIVGAGWLVRSSTVAVAGVIALHALFEFRAGLARAWRGVLAGGTTLAVPLVGQIAWTLSEPASRGLAGHRRIQVEMFGSGVSAIRGYLRRMPGELAPSWLLAVLGIGVLLVPVGLALSWRRLGAQDRSGVALVWVAGVGLLVTQGLSNGGPLRYVFPSLPLLLAAGLAGWLLLLWRVNRAFVAVGGVAAVAAALVLVPWNVGRLHEAERNLRANYGILGSVGSTFARLSYDRRTCVVATNAMRGVGFQTGCAEVDPTEEAIERGLAGSRPFFLVLFGRSSEARLLIQRVREDDRLALVAFVPNPRARPLGDLYVFARAQASPA